VQRSRKRWSYSSPPTRILAHGRPLPVRLALARASIAVTADCGDFSLDPYGDTTEEIYTFQDRRTYTQVDSGHPWSCVASDDGASLLLWYLPGDPQTYITADEFTFLLVVTRSYGWW
jgi:hypothetical protein